MRTKKHGSVKAKSQPISLFPDQLIYAQKRANTFGRGISLSKYLQSLIEYDRKHDVLEEAITLGKAVAA